MWHPAGAVGPAGWTVPGALAPEELRRLKRTGRAARNDSGAAGSTQHLAVTVDHLAAVNRHHRPSGDLPSFIRRVIRVGCQVGRADRPGELWIPNREVGV